MGLGLRLDDISALTGVEIEILNQLVQQRLFNPDLPHERYSNSRVNDLRQNNTLGVKISLARKHLRTEAGKRAAEQAERERMRQQLEHHPDYANLQSRRARLERDETEFFQKFQQQ